MVSEGRCLKDDHNVVFKPSTDSLGHSRGSVPGPLRTPEKTNFSLSYLSLSVSLGNMTG